MRQSLITEVRCTQNEWPSAQPVRPYGGNPRSDVSMCCKLKIMPCGLRTTVGRAFLPALVWFVCACGILAQTPRPDFSNPGYHRPLNEFVDQNRPDRYECTRYAWGRAYEKLGVRTTFKVSQDRHGGKWYDLITDDFARGQTPRANAFAVWSDGDLGHVAYVESVDSANALVTEANLDSQGSCNDPRTIPLSRFQPGSDRAGYGLGPSYKFVGVVYLPPWQKVPGPWPVECDGSFRAIAVSPKDPNRILLGSSHLEKGCGVYRSDDAGRTWAEKTAGLQKVGLFSKHYPAITSIAVAPSNPRVIYLGAAVPDPLGLGGYLYKSSDGGETWEDARGRRNIFGVPQIQGPVLSLAVDPTGPNIVFAGLSLQGVYRTTDGGTEWAPAIRGSITGAKDHYHIVRIGPSRNVFVAGGQAWADLPCLLWPQTGQSINCSGTLPLGPLRSNIEGTDWQRVQTPERVFLTDLWVDPSNADVLYFSTMAAGVVIGPVPLLVDNKGIFRSTDRGATWTAINNAGATDLSAFPVYCVSADAADPKVLFAAAGRNGVFGSRNGGDNWELLATPPGVLSVEQLYTLQGRLYLLTAQGVYLWDRGTPEAQSLLPKVASGLVITPHRPYAGEKIKARFTIINARAGCVTVRTLTVGGRDAAQQVADFPFMRNVALCGGQPVTYEGELRLTRPGSYHFFVTYQTIDGRWNTSVPVEPGARNTVDLEVLPGPDPANVFSVRPTISLSLRDPVKPEYRIGESIRLKMAMTAGQVAPSAGAASKVSIFLWVDAPNGRRFLTESQGRLVETATPSPVWKPITPIDYTWELLSTTVSPSSVAGTYTWNGAMYTSESMSDATLVARSAPLSYRILLERGPQPSVTSVRTSLNLYRVGDTMVIYYSTLRGTGTGNYDLMLRIRSKASGKDYYFYDEKSDTNRWIHQTARPMWSGVPQDGNFQIPSGNMPAIVIEDDTPSGDYTMTAYFSEPGKNTPVGNSAQTQFRLETPTPEGECFVATAAYGSPMASSVELLRSFRKRFLSPSGWGRGMVRIYERIGPRAAAAIRLHGALRKAARIVLWPVVAFAAVALRLNVWLAIFAAALVVTGFLFAMRRASNRVRLAMLALVLAAAAQAADVQGTVVRARPFPIPIVGARVELAETGQAVASDQDGGFRFLKLAGGEYTLKASSPGYLASSLKVSVPASTSVVKVVVPLNPVGERVYEYYLPHTAEGGGWWTFFNVLNSGSTAADLTMAAYDAEGNYLGASAKISRLKINQQLSGAPSNYFAPEVISKAAWYKLTSSVPLTGFEVFGSDQGSLAGFSLPIADSSQLYLPHVAQDDQWWTGLSFVSAGTRLSEFHLEARDRTGRLLAEAGWPKYLGPGEKTVDVINNYFGWDFPAEIQWASIRSDSPITGFELFGTRDFKMMAAVPALTQGAKKLYFPHVVTTDGWWTGIAMLNVDVRPGTLRMTAYGEDGKALADSRSISLVAGERTVGTAESFFDNWPTGVKYLEAASDVAVVGFELVGRSAPPLFGGLPALSAAGTRLAYSHAISTSEWETSLGILNTSGVSSQVTFQAFDANGNALAQVKVMLSPKGYGFGSLRSLFGRVPSGTAWVKASSDGAPLVGFFKLTRVSDGQFTDIPAEPIVAPEMIGSAAAATVLAERPELARLASQVEIAPVPGRGFRVSWPAELNSALRALVGDRVRPGDIIVEIGGIPVRTRSNLWDVYRRFRDAQDVGVVIWREDTGARAVRLRNPLAQSAR